MVVGQLCGPYGRKLSPAKVEAISAMKHDCNSVTEVWRFLRACTFYHIWIPHYAHVAELLYGVALLYACVEERGGTTGVLDRRANDRGKKGKETESRGE